MNTTFTDIVKVAIKAYNIAKNIQKLAIDKPITYQDKIAWLKVFDAIPEKTEAADKLKMHDYCKRILGKDLCVPVLADYGQDVDKINLDNLPDRFVLKCNHGSGYNVIVPDKSKLDLTTAKAKLRKCLAENYGDVHGELQYYLIEPRCYAEKFLDTGTEFQFLCFNGKPTFCQAISNRFDKARWRNNFYDMDFKFVDICNTHFPNNPNHLDTKPVEFEEMRSYAEKLAQYSPGKTFKLVRVDFYVVDHQIYLSEMTFSPGNAGFKFKNPEHSFVLGKMIAL